MSGIFGGKWLCINSEDLANGMIALKKWNQLYGDNIQFRMKQSDSILGICMDDFSEETDEEKGICNFVCDALIYNRDELLQELMISKSESISDESLIYALIEKKGLNSLAKVNGDFAGAFYQDGEWTIFRDHMGVRPLFFYLKDDTFVFSTDIRGIISLDKIDLKLNEKILYLRWSGHNYLDDTMTEFEYIHLVKPGSWMKVKEIENLLFPVYEHVYWSPGAKKIRYKDKAKYFEEMKQLITDSIRRRAERVHGSIGTELSGGLDSSVIAILLSRLGYNVQGVSWSSTFDEIPMQEVDERKVVVDVCEQEKIKYSFVNAHERSINELMANMALPYSNTWTITDTSKQMHELGVKAVFTGQGGDEGVSHRATVLEMWHHKEYMNYFREIFWTTRGKSFRILRTIKRAYYRVRKVYPLYFESCWMPYADASKYLNSKFVEKYKNIACPVHLFGIDPRHYIVHGGQRARLDNLAFQGAEQKVRYLIPYLDYRVVDYALGIPRWLYIHKGKERYIFIETFKEIMPESLRKVDYKDFASKRNYTPPKEKVEMIDRFNFMLAEKIDSSVWSQYWNIDKVVEVLKKKEIDLTEEEREGYDRLYDYIQQCVLIQNLISST